MPRRAIALGNFDGVHLGHQAVIARAFEGRNL
jgi:cytidyltransferase-like protein